MFAAAENESIACHTCGAQVAVSVGDERVACRPCGATTEIPPALRGRVALHADVVAQHHAQVRRLGDQEAGHRLAARTNLPLLWAILVFACAVPAWIIAHGTGATATMGPIAWCVAIGLTCSPLLVIAVARRRWQRRERVRIDAARERGRCGACGGPLELAEGVGFLPCAHCGATAVANHEQMLRLEAVARQRGVAAQQGVEDASVGNTRSLDGFNAKLRWLTAGPMGFAPFFALTLLVAGLLMFVGMAPAGDPGLARAGWISLAVCGGLAALALVWGGVIALQGLVWRRIVAAAGPRWSPRWVLVRDALGWLPAAAVCSLAGFTLLALAIDDPQRVQARDASLMMVALGFMFAFLALIAAGARVLWVIAGALLRRFARRR